MSARPVVIMAGGTGGHIFPGIAVARALSARGVPVRWMGSAGGLETKLVPEAGIAIDTLAIGGIRGKGLKTLLLAPWRLLQAVLSARRLLRGANAGAVISFGGFAAGPGGLAARWLGIPVFVHEQNSIAGLTNKVLARLARSVFTGFSAVRGLQGVWTGNPVRADIAALPAPEQRARQPGLRLLVLGGSQGARALNQVLPETIRALQIPNLEVRHQCGARMLDAARAAYASAGVSASVEPFIANMAEAYAWADIVVCRAGALTLAELCAAGVGAVLIPYPHAVDDHQTANARALLSAGAAVLLPEKDLTPASLEAVLQPLLADPARRLAMAKAARGLAKPDADQVVAELILKEAA